MTTNIQQAVSFFKHEKAYRVLFTQFKKKYESLGRIGGTVPISLFSENELGVLAGFFAIPAEKLANKKSISLVSFEQQLAHTRFADVGLKELLDAYFGEVIKSKKQSSMEQQEKWDAFLQDLHERFTDISIFMDYLRERPSESRWMARIATEEPERFTELVQTLAVAFINLPATAERLPMFSQRITGDPHGFDLDTDLGRMFLQLLSLHRGDRLVSSSTESMNELLEHYHLFRDDLLNFVTFANLFAETKDGEMHPVWQAAAHYQSVQHIPLRELINIANVYPVTGCDVWVVENSGVCSTLLDESPRTPMICTNGQFKLAAFLLMDMLTEAGFILHYAGDFDPEGLGMAQRLLDRYPEQARLWHMNVPSYRESTPIKKLTDERLEKLKGLTHRDLLAVAQEMRRIGKAGYQEALVSQMQSDISAY